MTSKEALKRLKQETAPATYMPDFDKDKCIEIIKQDLDRLEKIKGIFEDMKDARDNASFQQDDEVFLTIFTELSHWCEQLEEVLEEEIKLYQKDIKEAYRELRKYKLLEEELGIDLLTLFKALKDGIYIEGTRVYGEDLKFRYFIGDPCLEYEHRYQKIPMVTSVNTKDFNKTWWLAKPKENDDE